MKTFLAIDFETGNPQRVSACALGYAKVVDGEIVETNGFLVRPVGGHAEFQSKIHGIKEEHTADSPEFGELYPSIAELFTYPLVAHSLFDKQVLNALSSHFSIPLKYEYTDSSSIAKRKLPQLKDHKLKTLVKHFNLPKFVHHDAKEDALACAQVFLRLNSDEKPSEIVVPDEANIEFRGLIKGILADDEINYKEAYQLLYWLEDHPTVCDKQQELSTELFKALRDNHLDGSEASIIRSILNKHI